MSLFREEVLESRKDRLHGEVVLSQPLSTRIMSAVFFAIILIASVWVTLGTYARVETVPGILVTDIASTNIVVPQNGIVSKLMVEEGQHVEAGDTLMVVGSDRRAATGRGVAERGLGSVEARRQLTEAQVTLAGNRAAAERRQLEAVIAAADQRAASLRGQINLQEQVVASNQDMFDQVTEVVDRGFVSRVDYERRRQTLLGSQQQLASLEQQLSASIAEAQQARAQIATITVEAAQSVSQLQGSLESLSAEEARLEGEQGLMIEAPISGRVTALAIGVGRPAQPGRPLMVIVPDGAELFAELYAPSRAIGFVERGNETRLLYDAFPYQRFGSFVGSVEYISRTAIDPRQTDIAIPLEEPVYRIRVQLDSQAIEAFGEETPLQPGMTLNANLVLERQSFLSWLLQPLQAVLNRNS